LKIYRELAASNPQVYLLAVAGTLNNLGTLLININDYPQAETSFREALKIQRELASSNSQAYLPDVATTLNSMGILLININDYPKAEDSFREALKIRRELATSNPQVYLPDVAMTLANLAVFYLQNVPDREQSVKYAKEVLSYRSSLEHFPVGRRYIKIAEEVLKRWE
jgi:tetratricopeptide (TPR) repeat protein